MNFLRGSDAAEIQDALFPTIQAFVPELLKNKDSILSVKSKTFKYGETDRHQLDVYYPEKSNSHDTGRPPPILIFVYGGGFTNGDRRRAPPLDLTNANVGAFFSRAGFLSIIPDYRLAPAARYPDPSEDIRDALAFVVSSPEVGGDKDNVIFLGHSAGASIVSSLFLDPALLVGESGEDLRRRVRGLVLYSGAYAFGGPETNGLPQAFLDAFYGERLATHTPLALLKAEFARVQESQTGSDFHTLPPLLLLRSEKEPRAMKYAHDVFVQELEEETGGNAHLVVPSFEVIVVPFHNHFSPGLVLSTGEGEEWGEKVVHWAWRRVKDTSRSSSSEI